MKRFSILLLLIIATTALTGCPDEEGATNGSTLFNTLPSLTTSTVTGITQTSATLGGIITNAGSPAYYERGLCYSTSPNPTTSSNSRPVSGSGTGSFSISVTGLMAGTTYYVRAYAINTEGTAYGNQRSFETPAASSNSTLPALTTTAVTVFTSTTATLGGNITNSGTPPCYEFGVCFGTNPNPDVSNNKTVVSGSGTGSFSTNVSGLLPNTTYYVRAYAINTAGAAYGAQVNFTTSAGTGTLPALTTSTVTGITQTSATLGGNITNAGSPAYYERGVCYGTSSNPTTSNNKTIISGSETGNFSITVSGLMANTNYYVRAYAINTAGTVYGTQVSFTTLAGSGSVPGGSGTVPGGSDTVPAAPTGLTATNNLSQINLKWTDNADNETDYRVERSTNGGSTWTEIASSLPANTKTYDDTGLANGTYYYRVRAHNSTGFSAYSNTDSATIGTPIPTVPPSLTTAAASNITQTGATLGGNITASGQPPYSERGVCYSTSENPTTSNNKTVISGSGTGNFSISVSGLAANTTYYVRAYATYGISLAAYGDQVSFKTLSASPAAPTSLTATATSTTQINLSWTNNATNATGIKLERSTISGGPWSEITSLGATSTSYQNNSGLSAGTTYYYRVYAYNAAGDSEYATAGTITFPAAPTGLLASAASSSQINLSWSGVTGATGYQVERAPNSSGTWTVLNSSNAGTTYSSTGLSANTTYYYRVRAYNASGNSAYSTTANATTQATSYLNPAPVLTGPSTATGNILLSWTIGDVLASTNQVFRLEISRNNGAYTSIYDSANLNVPHNYTYSLQTQDYGITLRFRVKVWDTWDQVDRSFYSNIITVAVSASAGPLNVNPDRLNVISSTSPDLVSNQPSTFHVGQSHQVIGELKYCYYDATLMYFNINSQIAGKSIKSATLKMSVVSTPNIASGTYQVYTVAKPWTSSETWNHFNETKPQYILPGYEKNLPTSTGQWDIDVTNIVKAWATGTTNNGIMLWDGSLRNIIATINYTSGFSNSSNKPVLSIEFN